MNKAEGSKMIDIEEIKKAMNERKLLINRCRFCDYPCGYFFKGKQLFYDSGCNCVGLRMVEKREESELIEILEVNNHSIAWVKSNLI